MKTEEYLLPALFGGMAYIIVLAIGFSVSAFPVNVLVIGSAILSALIILLWRRDKENRSLRRRKIAAFSFLLVSIFSIVGSYIGVSIGFQHTHFPMGELFYGIFLGGIVGFLLSVFLAPRLWPRMNEAKKPLIEEQPPTMDIKDNEDR